MEPLLLVLLAGQALSFPEALARAEVTPAVIAETTAAERRAELAQEVSTLPYNPVVQLQPGARAFDAGGHGYELYLSVLQRFSLGGLGGERRTALKRELAHDHVQREVVLRSARVGAAEAWFARWLAQRAHAVANEEVALAERLIEQTRAAASAQEVTVVELASAQSWRAEAMLSALGFEGDEFEAGLALATAIGEPALEPRAVVEELPRLALPAQATLQASRARVDTSPAVVAARSELELASAHVAESRAARAPTMALGAMGWREGGGDLALVATIEAELPFFEGGERERAPLAAEQARAEGRQAQAQLAAQAERTRLLHELRHTQQTLQVAEGDLLAAAERMAEAQHQRLLAGEVTAYEWVLARRGVLSARLAVLRARVEHQRARFLVQEAWRGVAQRSNP